MRRTLAGRQALHGLPAGASVVDVTVALAITALLAAIGTPVFATSIDAGRARHAAQYLAAECRRARMDAIASSATTALVFERRGAAWQVKRCRDGNRNGVRTAEILSGKDPCAAHVVTLESLFGGVAFGVDSALPDPDSGPGTTDPVRFGASDIASFSPTGTASAGTAFIRSTAGAQYAVRVAGATGRTRVLRFDTGRAAWVEV